MEHKLHFGLDVAQYKLTVDPTVRNVDLMIQWARGAIEAWDIRLDDENYEVLLRAPEHFEVDDFKERQEYFRTIFMDCVKRAQQEPTVDNDECVYPTQQTQLTRAYLG